MVQLNTTYDKDLKQRVFVLKGEETYARTTDVLASLVSDYADCSTRMNYARVGIEISVLRNFGDGYIYIFDNDEQIHTYDLPWFDEVSEMESYYGTEDWEENGVIYSNGKLLIGTDSILTSGFNLAYDVEHNIKVKYSGNKYCLGSSSETLTFEMPVPELYESTLTMESGSDNVYIKRSEVTDITIEYTSKGEMINTKTVQLYNNGVLIDDDLELTKGVSSTITFSSGTLNIGLNSLRAVFIGDDESTYAETSLDISIGCQIEVTDYPTVLISGNTGSAKCTITDYFNNPITTGKVKARRYDATDISSEVSLDNDGKATISPISITSSKWRIAYVYDSGIPYSSEWITTTIANVTGISLGTSDAYVGNYGEVIVNGNLQSDVDASGLKVNYSYNSESYETTVKSGNTFSIPISGDSVYGDKTLTVSCGTYSASKTIHNVFYYWNKGVQEIQKNYYKMVDGDFSDGANWYHIHPYERTTAKFMLTYPYLLSVGYDMSFKVTDNIDELKIGVGRADRSGNITVEGTDICTPTKNSIVRIVSYSSTKKVYLNGTEVFSTTSDRGFPVLLISSLYYNSVLGFNELKVKIY